MAPSKALAARLPSDSPASLPSKLVGWLVSYADDARGVAHEIRAGRAFISGEEIPHNRLITIAERDLSSPHLALSASPRHRVMIQDIFSESGSYLIRGSSGEEITVRGPTELEHGDWVRVGAQTRFQVCLIDGAAAAKPRRSADGESAHRDTENRDISQRTKMQSGGSPTGALANADERRNTGERGDKSNRRSSTK